MRSQQDGILVRIFPGPEKLGLRNFLRQFNWKRRSGYNTAASPHAQSKPASATQSQMPASETRPHHSQETPDANPQHPRQLSHSNNEIHTGQETCSGPPAPFVGEASQPSRPEEKSPAINIQEPAKLEVPPADAREKSSISDVHSSREASTPTAVGMINGPGVNSQSKHRSNTDPTGPQAPGKGNGVTSPDLLTSSFVQADPEQPSQSTHTEKSGGTNHETVSSLPPYGLRHAAGVVDAQSEPAQPALVPESFESNTGQASSSPSQVDHPQPPRVNTPSPAQVPESGARATARDGVYSPVKPLSAMDDAPSSVADDVAATPRKGAKGKQRETTRERQNVKTRLCQKVSSTKADCKYFNTQRERVNGAVKSIQEEYKRKKGKESSWSIELGESGIVIRCASEGFAKMVENEPDLFNRFGKVTVKIDRSLRKVWVAESAEFSTATFQSDQHVRRGTLGGVILVNGKPFGLTVAHGIHDLEHRKGRKSDREDSVTGRDDEGEDTAESILSTSISMLGNREGFTSRDVSTGQVAAYRFSSTLVSRTPVDQSNDSIDLVDAADWALIELDGSQMPLNMVLNDWLLSKAGHRGGLERSPTEGSVSHISGNSNLDATEELLWRTPGLNELCVDTKSTEPFLIEDILTESEFTDSPSDPDLHRVPCVLVTRSSIINGFLGWGYSTFSMDGACFSVLRVDLQSQLGKDLFPHLLLEILLLTTHIVEGDSGSWVFVNDRLFGMAIARSGGTADPAGYVIPIEEVFRSISLSLSAEVRLPSLRDYKINFLSSRNHQCRWLGYLPTAEEADWRRRVPEFELLLAQIQAKTRGGHACSISDAHESENIISHRQPLLVEHHLLSRRHLHRHGLSEQTISSILLLEDVFPIRSDVSDEIISRVQQNRKRTHPTVNRHSIRRGDWVVEQFLLTTGGQNILLMFMFLWASLRSSDSESEVLRNHTKDGVLCRIAKVFSAIFVARGVPASRIPSTSELESLIRAVIAAYRSDKLGLIMTDKAVTVFSERTFRKREYSRVADDEATRISQLLIKLSIIARGNRSEVLVCGDLMQYLPVYATTMLGLGTEIRDCDSVGVWKSEKYQVRDSPDVIIYRNLPKKLRFHGSELLGKGEIERFGKHNPSEMPLAFRPSSGRFLKSPTYRSRLVAFLHARFHSNLGANKLGKSFV